MVSVFHLLVIFILIGLKQSGADVTVSRNSDYVGYGKGLKVTCIIEGEDFQFWKHETRNKVLSEGANDGGKIVVTRSTNQAELKFENVDETVAGNFSCVGSENVAFFLLYMDVSVDSTLCQKDQGLVFGANDKIKCLVRAYPEPSFEWAKKENGTYKKILDERFSPQPNGELRVRNIREYDAGEYKLTATIPRRESETEFKIQIYHRAEIDRIATPKEVFSYIGNANPVKMTCNASGHPTPNIKLTKDGKSVNFGFIEVIDEPGFYSVEFNTGYEDMFGTYAWTASNLVNEDTLGFRLIQAEAPKLVYADREIVGELGKDTIVKCEFTGKPNPSVTWFRNGKRLNSNDKYKILNDGEGELIIENTRKSDIGEYVCFVTNMMGNITGKPFITSVEVKHEPEAKKRSDSGGILIGIIIAIIFVVIVCVDLFCCFFNNCGVCFCLFNTACSKDNSSSKVPNEKEKKVNADADKALLRKTGEDKKTVAEAV